MCVDVCVSLQHLALLLVRDTIMFNHPSQEKQKQVEKQTKRQQCEEEFALEQLKMNIAKLENTVRIPATSQFAAIQDRT